MIKPRDLEVGKTVYAFTGNDIHGITIRKKGRIWFDVDPFYFYKNLDSRRQNFIVNLLKWCADHWLLGDDKEIGEKFNAIIYLNKEDAQKKLAASRLAPKIRKVIDDSVPLAALEQIAGILEALNND